MNYALHAVFYGADPRDDLTTVEVVVRRREGWCRWAERQNYPRRRNYSVYILQSLSGFNLLYRVTQRGRVILAPKWRYPDTEVTVNRNNKFPICTQKFVFVIIYTNKILLLER